MKLMNTFTLIRIRNLVLVAFVLVLTACTGGPPGGLQVIDEFEITRYEGEWYEIARLDHRFERGLSRVTANYEVQADNTVQVINRGYNSDAEAWEEALGKARFIGDSDSGALKVSFFGPFYGAYNIVALDKENYQWAMVTGPSFSYLWILARQPDIDDNIYNQLVQTARNAGFATDELIRVEH